LDKAPFALSHVEAARLQPRKSRMELFSVLFWSLVLATALVSYRWGSMVGLVFFIALLMTSAFLTSHLNL
jgi:hypothetical protein